MEIVRFDRSFTDNKNVQQHMDGLFYQYNSATAEEVRQYREVASELNVLSGNIYHLINDPLYQRYLGLLDIIEIFDTMIFKDQEGRLKLFKMENK